MSGVPFELRWAEHTKQLVQNMKGEGPLLNLKSELFFELNQSNMTA